MQSFISYTRRAIVSSLAVVALAIGMAGCASEVGSSSPDSTVYEVGISANGIDVKMDVKVSTAAAEDYEHLTGKTLDNKEINTLVGERVRKAVDEGMVELSADPNAQIEVVFDVAQKDSNPGLQAAGETCVVSWGPATYSYQIVIRDSYGCRYYNAVDHYDILHNNCNNSNTLQYLYSTQNGPYWGC